MSTKQLEKFSTEVDIPENVKVSIKSHMLNVEGPLGKTYKNFKKIPVDIEITDSKVSLKAQGTRNSSFAIMNTARSIIRNLIEGVIEGDDVIITGHVLTDVTQTAAEIENSSRVKNKDHRVFLDGVYKFEKKKGIEK